MRGNNSRSRPPLPIFTSDKSSICISTIYDLDSASHSACGIWLITGGGGHRLYRDPPPDITYWRREGPSMGIQMYWIQEESQNTYCTITCVKTYINHLKYRKYLPIFQILFLWTVSFYTHPNISDIFVGDERYLFNLTFHDIANY